MRMSDKGAALWEMLSPVLTLLRMLLRSLLGVELTKTPTLEDEFHKKKIA